MSDNRNPDIDMLTGHIDSDNHKTGNNGDIPYGMYSNELQRTTVQEWVTRLSRYENRLFSISTGSEDEFLLIGSRLRDFHKRAVNITKMASLVSDFMSGEDIVRAVDGLNDMLRKMEAHLEHSKSVTDHRILELENIMRMSEDMHYMLKDFTSITKKLNILSVTMRIQSSKIDQFRESFDVLANNIKELSNVISSKFGHIQDGLKSTGKVIKHTLSRLNMLKARQQEKAGVILEKTASSVCSLSERYGVSMSVANDVFEYSNQISGDIGEVVTSMQFHDITRQRFEHAKEAIRYMSGRLKKETVVEEGQYAPDGNYVTDLRHEVVSVCRQQSEHLNDTRDEFVSAVNGILESLNHISRSVAGISDRTGTLIAGENSDQSTFLLDIENALSLVISALSDVEESNELLRITGAVAETTKEIRGFVDDIEEIGDDIELIALNAGIKAEKIDEKGESLGVIAEAVQRLSADAHALTESIATDIKAIVSSIEELSASINMESDNRVGEMQDSMGALISTLRGLNSNVSHLLGDIDEEGKTLSDDIFKVADATSVHRKVSDQVNNIVYGLKEIDWQSRSIPGGSPEDEDIKRVDEPVILSNSGQTETERDSDNGKLADQGGAFDNVELFV